MNVLAMCGTHSFFLRRGWYLAAVVLCLVLAACGPRKVQNTNIVERPRPEDPLVVEAGQPDSLDSVFVYPTAGDLASLNPMVIEDVPSQVALKLFARSLVWYDRGVDEVIPGLAKSWEVAEDKRTYTFHLRRGVYWSDGEPFNVDDVLFTVKATLDKRYPSRVRDTITVDDVPYVFKRVDDYTFTMQTPVVYAPAIIKLYGDLMILPQHILQEAYDNGTLLEAWSLSTAKNDPGSIISLGPFVVESYQPGERLTMRRNPNYYAQDTEGTPLPYIERVIIKVVRDMNAGTSIFSQGLTDASLDRIQPGDAPWVERNQSLQDYTLYDLGITPSTTFLWFNLNPGRDANGKPYVEPYKLKWFQDQRFRQAISSGIDREGIVDGVLFGRGEPLYSFVSPANRKWWNPEIRKYPYDPAKSKALLAEAGFSWDGGGHCLGPEGRPVQFSLITNIENDVRTELCTVFKENMADLGIVVELRFIDFNTLIARTSDGFNYEAAVMGLGGGVPDPSSYTDIISTWGRMHLWNPVQETPATDWEARMDRLMLDVNLELDESKRRELYFEVQDILAEQQPVIMLIAQTWYFGLQNRWRNHRFPTMGNPVWNLEQYYPVNH